MSETDRNLYAPPQAPVSDVPATQAPALAAERPTGRPARVTTAVELLSLSIVLQLGVDELEGRGLSSALSSPSSMTHQVFTLGLAVAIVVSIARGHNWARILCLVSSVLTGGTLVASFALGMFARLTSLQEWTFVIQTILSAATAYLLFTKPARSWFTREEESP